MLIRDEADLPCAEVSLSQGGTAAIWRQPHPGPQVPAAGATRIGSADAEVRQ